jgi:hypothetical protein
MHAKAQQLSWPLSGFVLIYVIDILIQV